MTIEEIRAEYKKALGKEVPNNKKNDKEWMIAKADEFWEHGEIKESKGIPKEIQELADETAKQPNGDYYSGGWKFEVKAGTVKITKS